MRSLASVVHFSTYLTEAVCLSVQLPVESLHCYAKQSIIKREFGVGNGLKAHFLFGVFKSLMLSIVA